VRSHGTRAKYVVERCRCADCRRANSAYQTANEKRRSYERFGDVTPHLVPAREAMAYLLRLRQNGVGLRRISMLTGLSRTSLEELAQGRRRRVTWRTYDLVTGVCLDDRAPGRWP
jgi:hypothetical protein